MKKPVLIGGAIIAILLLALIIFVLTSGNRATADREIPGMGIPRYVYTGADDTLYGFTDNAIYAIAGDGSLKYNYTVPDGWGIGYRWRYNTHFVTGNYRYYHSITTGYVPAVSSYNGTLYVYLTPGFTISGLDDGRQVAGGYYDDGRLVAIGPDGNEQWNVSVSSYMIRQYRWGYAGTESPYTDTYIEARDGRIYVFHGYNESVYASNGTLLWSVENVSDPAAVDEGGNVYLMEAVPGDAESRPDIPPFYEGESSPMNDYRTPSVVLDAYYPNGTQQWRTYTIVPPGRGKIDTLPLYNNGTIYVASTDSVRAFDSNGGLKWTKLLGKGDYPFDRADAFLPPYAPANTSWAPLGGDFQVYSPAPFDREGNLYLLYPLENSFTSAYVSYLIVIGPDGAEVSHRKFRDGMYYVVSDDIAYGTEDSLNRSVHWQYVPSNITDVNDLQTKTLVASDTKTGERLWSYTFPTDMRTVVTVNTTNVGDLFRADEAVNIIAQNNLAGAPSQTVDYMGNPVSVRSITEFSIHPGTDMIYADFRTYNHESPVVFDQSTYVYSGGLYALDRNGRLLWRIPIARNTDVIAAGNSTILYGSGDGRVYVKYLGVAAGIALLSALALAGKFFLAGTISRARSRLDTNENRTAILRHIAENPGSTMHEIARDSGINLGTVRYHLLILAINHKIVEYRTDGKYVRFFTNSNSYSPEERMIISLMRRDAMGKVLKFLAHRPGASNAEISGELDLPESVTSRCTKELAEKGLVAREPAGNGFFIEERARDSVTRMMSRI